MAARKQPELLDAGSPIPDLRLKLLGGGQASLREIAARGPALLAFFKISCPVCQLTFPFLERLHATGTLAIHGISQNDARDTRDFNEDFGITFPTLLDDEDSGFPASNAFGISSVPTLFLVEPGGAISHVIEGWRKKEMEFLAAKAGAAVFRQGDNVPEWKAG
jgi:peroxiredoxin